MQKQLEIWGGMARVDTFWGNPALIHALKVYDGMKNKYLLFVWGNSIKNSQTQQKSTAIANLVFISFFNPVNIK